ncbi:MAG: hypothetical protein HYW49_10205 [Deltaproteobacteria bacterium]|nr:hypothetical protein [Deltaproteobacteria bacterium]
MKTRTLAAAGVCAAITALALFASAGEKNANTKKIARPTSGYSMAEVGGHITLNKNFKMTFAKKGEKPAAKKGRAVASSTAGNPPLFSNSVRYRDSGGKPGTGRSGTASLQTRALMDKNGTTQIEVTTGTIGSTTAPGNISKVQLKGLTGDGSTVFTRNWNGLSSGGSLLFSVANLVRRQPIQIQGNVRGIDPKRTDVVTVQDKVFLRPDLAAVRLQNPERANVGVTFNIAATVSELNGDVGASGNCVLYVDGVEADRANGIWVDAGGTVSCAFTQRFDTAGTRQLAVKIENVNPGDWDLANNSATSSIEIVEPVVAMDYYAWAYDYRYRNKYKQDYNYHYSYDTYDYHQVYLYDYNYDSKYQQTGFNVYKGGAAFTFPANLSVKESSDGTETFNLDLPNTSSDWGYDYTWNSMRYQGGCVYRMVGTYYYGYIYVCSQKATINGNPDPGNTYTYGYYSRFAGDVTYHSSQYEHYWSRYYGYDYYYSYNYDYAYSYGTNYVPMGSGYAFDISFSDGSTTLVAKPEIQLQDYSYGQYQRPWSCYEYSIPEYNYWYRNCWEQDYSYGYKYGYTSGSGN